MENNSAPKRWPFCLTCLAIRETSLAKSGPALIGISCMIHSSDAAVMCVPRDKIMLQVVASAFCLPLIQLQTVLSTQSSDYFSNCPKYLLEPDEYVVLDDGTVSVLACHRTYTQNQFRIRHDGRLEICTESIEYVDKFNPSMSYVTMAGLRVSFIFLALHLAAFTILPELRNFSGKNLASLCISLLAAYTAFILDQFLEVTT
jgi:hypothetical protein